jgi:hypothetical protein
MIQSGIPMRSRSTLILVLIALGLFGYIWLFERDGTDPTAPTATEQRVFPSLDPTRVNAVTLVQGNIPIRLERVRSEWQLKDPSYPAQNLLVDNWLETVANLQRSALLEARDVLEQPGGIAAFGLDPPQLSVTLEQGTNQFQFHLGHRTPLGAKMYLQQVGADTVEITGSEPLDRLPATASDWRDPQFLNLARLQFDRVELQSAARSYAVARETRQAVWRLEQPRAARADHGRVEQLLQQLQSFQVDRFLADDPGDLESFGLLSPQATWTLSLGTNPIVTVEFGRSPTNAPEQVYARRSTLPGVVLVSRQTLDLVAVPYSDLLDWRLVARPFEGLKRIEVNAAGRIVLERLETGAWQMIDPAGMPTDPGLMSSFLERIHGLRILEVAKEVVTELDLPTYGLAPPSRQYDFHWAPPTPTPDAQPFVLRLEVGTNRTERVFVRRSDESPVYAVSLNDVLALPEAPFKLRDRRLWNFKTNDVTSVTVTQQGETRKLLRSSGGQWTFAPGSQGMVNTFALEEAMHRLGTLRARFWEARGTDALPRYGIPQVGHRLAIDINQAGQTRTLIVDFGATSPSGGPFAAMELEGEPTVFEFPLDVFYPYDEVVRSMAPPRAGAG